MKKVPAHVKAKDRKVYKLKRRVRILEAEAGSLREKVANLERLLVEVRAK